MLLKMRSYFGFGCHDCVTSFAPEERLKAWERVLQIAIENKTLLVTFSEAADLFRRAAALHHYSINAKRWNRGEKTFYRPTDTYPTDWAHIGTIQSKFTPQHCRRTIPVSAFVFRFPSQRYDRLKTCLANIGRHFPKPIKRVGKWILYR